MGGAIPKTHQQFFRSQVFYYRSYETNFPKRTKKTINPFIYRQTPKHVFFGQEKYDFGQVI